MRAWLKKSNHKSFEEALLLLSRKLVPFSILKCTSQLVIEISINHMNGTKIFGNDQFLKKHLDAMINKKSIRKVP